MKQSSDKEVERLSLTVEGMKRRSEGARQGALLQIQRKEQEMASSGLDAQVDRLRRVHATALAINDPRAARQLLFYESLKAPFLARCGNSHSAHSDEYVAMGASGI